ncbi:MAG: hypothetical protein P1U56_12425 [Saprospiraceae bacterium]|nr:hypothetical protein [Saprospiraceae bacterium]
MKYFYFTFLCLLFCTCGKEVSETEVVIGSWNYTRQIPTLFTFLTDVDKKGELIINEDGTGTWTSTSVDSLSYPLNWKFELDQSKFRIQKFDDQEKMEQNSNFSYLFECIDENNLKLTFTHQNDVIVSDEVIELVRK